MLGSDNRVPKSPYMLNSGIVNKCKKLQRISPVFSSRTLCNDGSTPN
jgi:hypothetical protein